MKKIVLVEDNKFDAEFVQMILKNKAGFKGEIVWLSHGGLFLDFLKKNDCSNVLFALLDLKMPVISGIEVLEELSKNKILSPPIVVYSASMQASDIDKCLRLNANAFIMKAVEFEDFERSILGVYDFWAKFNVLRLQASP